MKELIFDCETTGLIPKKANYLEDYEDYPYIVQLSWDFDGEIKDYIIKPEDWKIPESATEIHGITQTMAETTGHNFNDVMIEFINDCSRADTLIGYNIYFDTSIIKANILRAMPDMFFYVAEDALNKHKRIDLMYKVISFVDARQSNGSIKFPTLEELYFKLFNKGFPAHNSKEDVMATKECYLELIENGIL